MPRARQMPRTRRLRRWRAVTSYTALAVLAAGTVMVRAAGSAWPIALGVLVVVAVLLVLGVKAVFARLDRAQPAARAADLAELSPEQRGLPYGVVKDDGGALGLPSKSGYVVATWAIAVLLVGLGAWAMIGGGEPGMRWFGLFLVVLGIWLGVCAWWITGVRIRLTGDGIETRMGPRRSYEWLEVPEIKVNRLIIIVKAAGKKRPRVWVRTGLLEASFNDCLTVIRQQRGW